MYARKTGTVLLIALATLIAVGCARPVRSWELSDPIMFANQDGGCAAGAAGCRYQTGLLLAVWPDGRVLRAESADAVGLRYVLGSPTAEHRETLRATVDQLAGFDASPDQAMPPGSASHHVVVARPTGPRRSWRFPIPVEHETQAFVEERLISIMQIELEDARSVHWTELPRFDSPVVGNWRSVHAAP